MEKIKRRILIGILFFICGILIVSKISVGFTIGGEEVGTDKALAELAGINPESIFNWKFDSTKTYKLILGGGTIEEHTATCMYHQQSNVQGEEAGYDYVTDVIDIEGNTITINGTTITGTTSEQKKYIAAMVYAINSAYNTKDAINSEGKTAFRYFFQSDKIKSLIKTKISDNFITSESNGVSTANEVVIDALSYGYKVKDYKEMESVDTTPTIIENGNVTYIGPFKMKTNENDIDKITLDVKHDNAEGKGEITTVYKKNAEGEFEAYENIPSGKNFYVKVNAKNVTEWALTISGNAKIYKARILLIENRRARGQNLAIFVSKDSDKFSSELTWSGKAPGMLEIIKVDKDLYNDAQGTEDQKISSSKIGGAKVKINNETEKSVTNGKITLTLEAGIYKVKESKAPDGYDIDTTEYTVEVTPGKTTRVIIKNKKAQGYGTLVIKKRDMDLPGTILYGSKMRVTGPNGISEYNLNSDQLVLTVVPGNYTVEEIGAPNGYSLERQKETVGIEIVKSVTVVENVQSEVIFYNKKYPNLTITKLDKITGRGASGARFVITYNGTYLTCDDDGNGVYSTDYREFDMGIYSSKTIKNIYSGNYHVIEVGAPTGYDINLQEPADKVKDIEVGNGNVELKLYNMRYETLKIKKVDKNSDEIMEGVGFKIRQSEKYLKILNGNYAVTEITGKVEINPVYNQNPSNPYHAEWIDNENEATTFYTDNFGEIEIKNLEANKKYTVKETDIKGDMAMYYPITGEEFDIELKTYSSEEEKQADAIAEIIKKIRNDEKVRSDIFNKNLDEGDMKEHIRFLYDRFNGGDGIENKILMEILKLKYQELEEENFIKFIMCIEDYQYEYTKFVNDYYKGIIEEKAKNITVKDKEMLNREFENFMLNLDSSEFNLSEDTMLFYVKYNSDNSDNSDNSERKFKVDKNAVIENNYNNLNLCALQIVIEGFTFEISVEEIEDEANGEKEFKVIVKDVTSDSDLRKIEDNYENLFEGKRYYDFVIYEGMKSAVNELYEYYTTKNPDEISQMTKKSKIEYYVRRARGEFLIVVENEQKWMSLSGKVWEDKISSSKDSSRNKLLDEWEPLVSGINVYLKRNGVVIAERKTDSNGSYFFGGTGKYNENDPNSADYEILVKNAEEYSIEFSYNGLAYQSVEANIFSERGSKATDLPEDRNKVNENFSTILEGSIKGNDGITTGKTGTDVNLTYTTEYEGEGEKSRLIDTTSYTVDSLNGKINPIDKAIVRANTETGYQIKWKPGIYVVQNINLGICARQQPDITISTDLDNIKFEINGYSHNYDYNGRASYIKEGLVDVADPAYDALMDGFSIKAKNATGGYKNMSYTREIYDSYIAYTKLNSESENKLKVFVTYKLTLKNESSISKIIINSLKNYADKSLIYDSSWIDNGARVNWGSDISNSNEYSLIQSGIINKEIEPGKIVNVYLRYQLSTDAICNLVTLGEDDEYTLKTNTTEIVSYSSYDSNGNKYGGIDRDSAPGNIDYINIKGYEDDTDATPDLIIKRKISKKITGTVFEDYTYPFLNSDRERKGDGIYDEDENTVKDVKVQLLNYDGDNQVNIYKIDDSRKCSSNLSRSLHG